VKRCGRFKEVNKSNGIWNRVEVTSWTLRRYQCSEIVCNKSIPRSKYKVKKSGVAPLTCLKYRQYRRLGN